MSKPSSGTVLNNRCVALDRSTAPFAEQLREATDVLTQNGRDPSKGQVEVAHKESDPLRERILSWLLKRLNVDGIYKELYEISLCPLS